MPSVLVGEVLGSCADFDRCVEILLEEGLVYHHVSWAFYMCCLVVGSCRANCIFFWILIYPIYFSLFFIISHHHLGEFFLFGSFLFKNFTNNFWLYFFFFLRRTSPPFLFFLHELHHLFLFIYFSPWTSPFFFIFFLVEWPTCYLGLVGKLLLSSHLYYSALTHSADTQACSTATQSASWSQ